MTCSLSAMLCECVCVCVTGLRYTPSLPPNFQKHQSRFSEPSSYTRRLTLEDPAPGLTSPSKVLDESFLEWRPNPCGTQPDRQQVSIPTPTSSLHLFPPGMERSHCQRAETQNGEGELPSSGRRFIWRGWIVACAPG